MARKLSAETRRRMSLAQKDRWAGKAKKGEARQLKAESKLQWESTFPPAIHYSTTATANHNISWAAPDAGPKPPPTHTEQLLIDLRFSAESAEGQVKYYAEKATAYLDAIKAIESKNGKKS